MNEAVSNSVEHGYLVTPDDIDVPGSIRVEARLVPGLHHTRSAVFTVRDGGRWREPRADDPHRGHGLHIIAQLRLGALHRDDEAGHDRHDDQPSRPGPVPARVMRRMR